MDFGRRNINTANKIYGYSTEAAMGRFKHSCKGMKIDRITEDIAASVPPEVMKYYKDIHLDIDILFVNKTAFLLAISQNIRFIHYKTIVSSISKRV